MANKNTFFLSLNPVCPYQYRLMVTFTLQEKADRFQDLVVYIRDPHPFLACRACRVAVPLSCIPIHFAELKIHNFERRDVRQHWQTSPGKAMFHVNV